MNIKEKLKKIKDILLHSPLPVKCSICIMGTGQLLYKQWLKGITYLAIFGAMIAYMVMYGVTDIKGFITLGTTQADPWLGTTGDDSVLMMLRGLLTFIIIIVFLTVHISNIKDTLNIMNILKSGKKIPSLRKRFGYIMDKKFYVVALAVPVIGV